MATLPAALASFLPAAVVVPIAAARGALYPLVGGGDPEDSWGGPTLLGAWAAHAAIGFALVVLLGVVLRPLARHQALLARHHLAGPVRHERSPAQGERPPGRHERSPGR